MKKATKEPKGRPVLITVNASAEAEGDEPESISLLTSGELWEEEDGYRLRYEEQLDETTPTQVDISLHKGVVTMQRSGDYTANMVFQKGHRYEGIYNTPMGALRLALFCTQVNHAIDDQGGALHLRYQLDINEHYVAMHDMELCFAAKENPIQ